MVGARRTVPSNWPNVRSAMNHATTDAERTPLLHKAADGRLGQPRMQRRPGSGDNNVSRWPMSAWPCTPGRRCSPRAYNGLPGLRVSSTFSPGGRTAYQLGTKQDYRFAPAAPRRADLWHPLEATGGLGIAPVSRGSSCTAWAEPTGDGPRCRLMALASALNDGGSALPR